jgi:two-component SAPR family response regulator
VDDEDTTSSLKIVLEQNGPFEVDAFSDPIKGLASFKVDKYDLVLLEVRIQGIEVGFGLYRKIKAIDKKVKVCFLTSVTAFHYRTVYPDLIKKEKNQDCILDKPVGSERPIREMNKILISY